MRGQQEGPHWGWAAGRPNSKSRQGKTPKLLSLHWDFVGRTPSFGSASVWSNTDPQT